LQADTNVVVAPEAAERESAAAQIEHDRAVVCAAWIFRHNGEIRLGDVLRGVIAHRNH
jgi:hypothetical protein